MSDQPEAKKRSYLYTVLNHLCPNCREGFMFLDKSAYHLKSFMRMNEKCEVCGQKTELEAGFYYGTGYVSYALSVAFSVSTFLTWWVLIGLSVDDNRIFWWLITNSIALLLLQPYFMRLSRSLWLAVFVHYNENWRTEKAQIVKQVIQ